MRYRENWHLWLMRLISFGFIDWANSPKMLQLEIRNPTRYRLLVWPPLALLISSYFAFVLWLRGAIGS